MRRIDWQTVKDLAYSRKNWLYVWMHLGLIALSILWLKIILGWLTIGYIPTHLIVSIFYNMSVFPMLYLFFILLNFQFIWEDRKQLYYRYMIEVTDDNFNKIVNFARDQRFDYRLGGGMWLDEPSIPGQASKWGYQILFSRADQWMLVKMRF